MKQIEFVLGRPFITYDTNAPYVLFSDSGELEFALECYERHLITGDPLSSG
jgi:hypothetical protein